jgi:hypothetical protein
VLGASQNAANESFSCRISCPAIILLVFCAHFYGLLEKHFGGKHLWHDELKAEVCLWVQTERPYFLSARIDYVVHRWDKFLTNLAIRLKDCCSSLFWNFTSKILSKQIQELYSRTYGRDQAY